MKSYLTILKLLTVIVALEGFRLHAAISTPYGGPIEAIIFDCDGVLVDTEYLKFMAWQDALASEGISLTPEEYKPLVGLSSVHIIPALERLKQRVIPREISKLKNAKYRVLQMQGVPPIQEMVAFAKSLAEEKHRLNIKLGLASSASTEEILCNLQQVGLDEAFDLIISGSDDLGDYVDEEGKNKPKPYIYIEAAKRLGVPPAQCLVFEDSAAGIEAAVGAGMMAIAVPNQWTAEQDFTKATAVIDVYFSNPSQVLLLSN